ncbi:MAG TPA: EamA family transporter, partial [Azospirillaceae bacterium]|nr:EamA family transporter [Azospirillaceae bacterium]
MSPVLIPPEVAALVLLAALMHASWGALAKGGGKPELDVALMYGVQTLVALAALPALPLPDPASWPWLGTAVVIHTFYVGFIIAAYRVGDLSHVYPIMRGTPPLMVAAASTLWLGETLGPWAWAGVALICGG